jgi:hypothetical protein
MQSEKDISSPLSRSEELSQLVEDLHDLEARKKTVDQRI